jgi:dolichol kinase
MVVCAVAVAIVVTVEVTRRIWPRWNEFLCRVLFGPIARPREFHKTTAMSWYTVSVALCAALLPKVAAEVGVLVLALGDPAAGILGRKWGRAKIRHEKSWVGSGAFVFVGALAGFGVSWLAAPDLGLARRVAMCVTAAFAGALAELFSDRLDDNLTVPLAAGGVAGLWVSFL